MIYIFLFVQHLLYKKYALQQKDYEYHVFHIEEIEVTQNFYFKYSIKKKKNPMTEDLLLSALKSLSLSNRPGITFCLSEAINLLFILKLESSFTEIIRISLNTRHK